MAHRHESSAEPAPAKRRFGLIRWVVGVWLALEVIAHVLAVVRHVAAFVLLVALVLLLLLGWRAARARKT